MLNRMLPHAPTLSADAAREGARAKAVRASYEFWSTGDDNFLEWAFAETFAEHAALQPCAPVSNDVHPIERPGASEMELK